MPASRERPVRVALVFPDGFSLWQPRRGLIRLLLREGLEVHAVSAPDDYVDRVTALGARHIPIPFNRFVAPATDLRTFLALYHLFRRGRYDVVHNFTTKVNIYGALAARLAGVPRVVMNIEGVGYAFTDTGGLQRRALHQVVRWLYRMAAASADVVRFLQQDDRDLFIAEGILPYPEKGVVIRGEGVNLQEYSPGCVPPERVARVRQAAGVGPEERLVVLTARPLWSKGVREFIQAAHLVCSQVTGVRFVHVGLPGEGPDAMPEEYLRTQEGGAYRWLGFWPDLREVYAAASVVVLPSYYREGVPASLYEAMAMGKPLVATDNVGCREVVDHGYNGFLVRSRDAQDLARAILTLVSDGALLERFSRNSRAKAEREWDEEKIYSRFLTELYDLRFDPDRGRWLPGPSHRGAGRW